MPIQFPLNSVFEQTFQGHPLADAAWMYYVTAGNRQRTNHFLKDSRGENLVGGQLFESTSYDSIPQLILTLEELVDRFMMMDSLALGEFVSFMFAVCRCFADPEDGLLRSFTASEAKNFPWFAEPNSSDNGVWLDAIFKQVSTHFRTVCEARNQQKFEDLYEAHSFWDQAVMKDERNFSRKYDQRFVGQMMGYGALESDGGQGYEHQGALIPLLFDKISEVVTWCYKNGKWDQLMSNFDKKFQHYAIDISYFLKLQARPNERLNMPKDRLSLSSVYEEREFLQKIKDENREHKKTLLTLFAMAGHDFAHTMGPALKQYQGAREDDLYQHLIPFVKDVPDRIFDRFQFDQEAVMDRPNLAYILKFMSETASEQLFRQYKAAEGTEMPSQEFLEGLEGPPQKTPDVGWGSGIFLFAGGILAVLFLSKSR